MRSSTVLKTWGFIEEYPRYFSGKESWTIFRSARIIFLLRPPTLTEIILRSHPPRHRILAHRHRQSLISNLLTSLLRLATFLRTSIISILFNRIIHIILITHHRHRLHRRLDLPEINRLNPTIPWFVHQRETSMKRQHRWVIRMVPMQNMLPRTTRVTRWHSILNHFSCIVADFSPRIQVVRLPFG